LTTYLSSEPHPASNAASIARQAKVRIRAPILPSYPTLPRSACRHCGILTFRAIPVRYDDPMRLIVSSVFCLAAILAVTAAPLPQGREPKNLKVLKPDEVRASMGEARQGLGVECSYCHIRGDFASDENPKKLIARRMFGMTHDINASFPDGKVHVTCYTCHRGAAEPLTAPPAAAAAPKQ
jgi:Photosynthetic reaction centre cytochrome C subunit